MPRKMIGRRGAGPSAGRGRARPSAGRGRARVASTLRRAKKPTTTSADIFGGAGSGHKPGAPTPAWALPRPSHHNASGRQTDRTSTTNPYGGSTTASTRPATRSRTGAAGPKRSGAGRGRSRGVSPARRAARQQARTNRQITRPLPAGSGKRPDKSPVKGRVYRKGGSVKKK